MADVARLLAIMARLRDPVGGCPWDLEQDFASIAPYTIEEAYEVEDAIRQGDLAGLRDELGDLLLQVVFHARMAEEAGEFAFPDIVDAICDKLVRRHPHVFGDAEVVADAEAQTRAWEEHKALERASNGGVSGALAGVPLGLPALMRTGKLSRRAARVGFQWPDAEGALAKLEEEVGELAAEVRSGGASRRIADELGDLLFAASVLASGLGLEAEEVLRSANARFEERFAAMESALAKQGRAPEQTSAEEWGLLWKQAKEPSP